MRTLHVTETLLGGVGTYINLLAGRLAEENGSLSVLVVAPDAGRQQLPDVPAGCIASFIHTGRTPATFLRMAWLIATMSRRFKPEVIHLHSTFAGVIGRILVAIGVLRCPVVYCSHGWAFSREMSNWKVRLTIAIEKVLGSFCDSIVAISQYDLDEGIRAGLPAAKMVLIENGVKADFDFSGPVSTWPEEKRLKALFIGRLDRQKGFDILAEVAASAYGSLSVRVAGVAVVEAQKIDTLSNNVEMLGWLSSSELAEQLRACDVVVIPSRWEGFGLVAVEAMRAAKAVVAARTGGLQEIVRHEVSGLLFHPVTVASLSECLSGLDRQRCREMGVEARKIFLERYTFDRTYSGMIDLYHSLVSGKEIL